MEINNELLDELTEFAKHPGVTLKSIALSLGIEFADFLDLIKENNQVRDALNKGYLTWNIGFIKKIDQLSNQGSGPAQSLIYKILQDARFQELRDQYK